MKHFVLLRFLTGLVIGLLVVALLLPPIFERRRAQAIALGLLGQATALTQDPSRAGGGGLDFGQLKGALGGLGKKMKGQELSKLTFDCNGDLAIIVDIAGGKSPRPSIDSRALQLLGRLATTSEHTRVRARCDYETQEQKDDKESDPNDLKIVSSHFYGQAVDVTERGVIQENLWKKTLVVPLSWQLLNNGGIFKELGLSLDSLTEQIGGKVDLLSNGKAELERIGGRVRELTGQLRQYSDRFKDASEQIRDLREQVGKARGNVEQLSRQLNGFTASLHQIQQQLYQQANFDDFMKHPFLPTVLQQFMEHFPVLVGSINELTDRIERDDSPELRELLNQKLGSISQLFEAFSAASGEIDLKNLPESVRGELEAFRQRCFTAGGQLRPTPGIVAAPAQPTSNDPCPDLGGIRSEPPSEEMIEAFARQKLLETAFSALRPEIETVDSAVSARDEERKGELGSALDRLSGLAPLGQLLSQALVPGATIQPIDPDKPSRTKVVFVPSAGPAFPGQPTRRRAVNQNLLGTLDSLAALRELAALTQTEEGEVKTQRTYAGLKNLKYLEGLFRLRELEAVQLTDLTSAERESIARALENLAALGQLKYLAELDRITNCSSCFAGLESLEKLEGLSQLASLIRTDPAAADRLDLNDFDHLKNLARRTVDEEEIDPADPFGSLTLPSLDQPQVASSVHNFGPPVVEQSASATDPLAPARDLRILGRGTIPEAIDPLSRLDENGRKFVEELSRDPEKLTEIDQADRLVQTLACRNAPGKVTALRRSLARLLTAQAAPAFEPEVGRCLERGLEHLLAANPQAEPYRALINNPLLLLERPSSQPSEEGILPPFGGRTDPLQAVGLPGDLQEKLRTLGDLGRLQPFDLSDPDIQGKIRQVFGGPITDAASADLQAAKQVFANPGSLLEPSLERDRLLGRIGFDNVALDKLDGVGELQSVFRGGLSAESLSDPNVISGLERLGVSQGDLTNIEGFQSIIQDPASLTDQNSAGYRQLERLGLGKDALGAIGKIGELTNGFKSLNPDTIKAELLRQARHRFAQFMLNHPDPKIRAYFRKWDAHLTRIAPTTFYKPRARAAAHELVELGLSMPKNVRPIQIITLFDLDGEHPSGLKNLGSFSLKERKEAVWFVHYSW